MATDKRINYSRAYRYERIDGRGKKRCCRVGSMPAGTLTLGLGAEDGRETNVTSLFSRL